MVSQGTQGVGGAVQAENNNIGTQVSGYGTAVGSATQYGLDTNSAVNGVLQGVTNVGNVAAENVQSYQGGDVSQAVQSEVQAV